MTNDILLFPSRKHPISLRISSIFASLQEEEDRAWSQRCHVRCLRAGENLVDHADESTDLFLLQSGEVRAVLRFGVGKEAIVGVFRRHELMGELSAIDEMPRAASLTAVNDSVVTVIPSAVFNDILGSKPQVNKAVLQLLSLRMRQLNDRVSELSFLDTKHRLYNTLLRLSRIRMDGGGERVISPPIVHSELAEHIGSSRETVSREMARLMREALVERTSRAIILKDPGELSSRISRALQN